MKREIGPLDKRKRVTRCQSCAKRRIKCEGGVPCEYCTRTDKICQRQQPVSRQVKFIAVGQPVQQWRNKPPVQIHANPDVLCLDLFVSFIKRCQFTQRFVSVGADLLPLIYTSSSVQDLAIAIGSLEANRRGSVVSYRWKDSPQYKAFNLYGRAIQALQSQLQSADAACREDLLWTTFLLGIFELVSETTGDQWAKHMFYGTSKMLQLAGPTAQLSPLSNKLFEAFRILEANRAILYGDDTFLSEDAWLKFQQRQTLQTSDPMETVLELMIRMSSFSKRFYDVIEGISESLRPTHPSIESLAREGISFQQQLQGWHDNVSLHVHHLNPHLELAYLNYHSLLLFLCRNYTFYSCWKDKTIPMLTLEDVEGHITHILDLSESILAKSEIPGVSLLFPLRMAGANITGLSKQFKILNLLTRVHTAGFIVSERIKVDLQQLWEHQARQGQAAI